MPSHQRPKYDWESRISFVVVGRKPRKADLPGLDIVLCARYPNGKKAWRCCLDGVLAN